MWLFWKLYQLTKTENVDITKLTYAIWHFCFNAVCTFFLTKVNFVIFTATDLAYLFILHIMCVVGSYHFLLNGKPDYSWKIHSSFKTISLLARSKYLFQEMLKMYVFQLFSNIDLISCEAITHTTFSISDFIYHKLMLGVYECSSSKNYDSSDRPQK